MARRLRHRLTAWTQPSSLQAKPPSTLKHCLDSMSSSSEDEERAAQIRAAAVSFEPAKDTGPKDVAPKTNKDVDVEEVAIRVARKRLSAILDRKIKLVERSEEPSTSANGEESEGVRLFTSASVLVSDRDPVAAPKKRRKDSSSESESEKLRAAAVSCDWLLAQAAPLAKKKLPESEQRQPKKKKKEHDSDGEQRARKKKKKRKHEEE